jgi:hypothetical protein
MRVPVSIMTSLGAFVSVGLLAGCSGAVSQPGPPGYTSSMPRHAARQRSRVAVYRQSGSKPSSALPRMRAKSFVRPFGAHTAMAYLSDYDNDAVYGFDRSGKLLITITGLDRPQGLFVDRAKNVWVANSAASNIEVFAKGSVRPLATYNDANEEPVDVAVCPHGRIYASSIIDGTISVYAAGKPNPIRTLTDANSYGNFFITCDTRGNVFVTFDNGGPGGVDEYVGGVQSGLVTLPIQLGFPGGITIDSSGNLLVDDQKAQTVSEYSENGIPTGKVIDTGSGDIVDIAITRKGTVVGGADSVNSVGKSWAFPSGAKRRTYAGSFTLAIGFAYDPGRTGI